MRPEDVRLSIVVTHLPSDPRRREMLLRIERALGIGWLLNVELDRYLVLRDWERRGVWPITREAMLRCPRDATHHLVLQDDMLPCPDFLLAARAAIAAHPDEPICFFSMRRCIGDALARGQHWIRTTDACWGGSTVLPASLCRPFVAWSDAHIPASYRSADRRLCLYLIRQQIPVWLTAPCLLQHIGAGISTIGNSNQRRITPYHAGAGGIEDAAAIDWMAPGYLRTSGGAPPDVVAAYQERLPESIA